MIYGYCRISTRKQSIERQIRNIKAEFPDAVIIQETYTGTKLDRKEWNKLSAFVRTGDTIVFDSVSRMSRNAEEGFATYEGYTSSVTLIFLKEPHINTATFSLWHGSRSGLHLSRRKKRWRISIRGPEKEL